MLLGINCSTSLVVKLQQFNGFESRRNEESERDLPFGDKQFTDKSQFR